MSRPEVELPRHHEDPEYFREAVRYTAAETRFVDRLVEKDYFATLVLAFLSSRKDKKLIFKGGTCLAKIHTGFFRLSEDLDFMISVEETRSRKDRQALIANVKGLLGDLPAQVPVFHFVESFRGANQSRQYLGTIGYQSLLTRGEQRIKIEVSLREPLLTSEVVAPAKTLLLDPVTEQQLLQPVGVRCLSLAEAMSEKCRAALSRREAAIRDFYDVDHAVRKLGFELNDPAFHEMVARKLAVAGNDPVQIGPERIRELRAQLNTLLRPVLRPEDFGEFDLDRAYEVMEALASRLE
jgi:predicted nucleotidyltransferase component of viral defense system